MGLFFIYVTSYGYSLDKIFHFEPIQPTINVMVFGPKHTHHVVHAREGHPAVIPSTHTRRNRRKKIGALPGDFSSSKHNDVEFIGQLELALQWHLHIDKNIPLPMKVGDLLHRNTATYRSNCLPRDKLKLSLSGFIT